MLQYVSWMKGMCVGGNNRMETIPRNRWTCYEDKTNGAGDIARMFKTLGLDPECHVCAHTKTQERRHGQRIIRASRM